QLIIRTLVYSLMTVSVVVIVTILMLIILGYSFNRQDGRLEQGGLLQFASIPSGATVTLNEMKLGSRTPSKTNADARSHSVRMDLSGYRAWHKTMDLRPGSIGWLSYARLIPTEIKPQVLREFPTLGGALASSERNWMLLQEDPAVPQFV